MRDTPKQITFEELSAACGKQGPEKEELLRSLRQTECTGWLLAELNEKVTLIPYGLDNPADKAHPGVIVGYMPASHLAWLAELKA